jgi:alpha-tubulin suppressor-like RCC1 family protein
MKIINASQLYFSQEIPRLTKLNLDLFLGEDCCVVSSKQGHIWCWGNNHFDKLGFSTYPDEKAVLPHLLTHNLELDKGEYLVFSSFGYDHNAFLTNQGSLILTGKNEYNQLGYPKKNSYFTSLEKEFNLINGEKILKIHLSDYRSAALTNFGRLFVWGINRPKQYSFLKLEIAKIIEGDKNSLKPTEITKQINLNNDEIISDFQLVNSTNAALIIVTNKSNIYQVDEKGKVLINHMFKTTNSIKIKTFISNHRSNLLLTEDNQVFLWGADLFDKDKLLKHPQLISFDLNNDHIISIKLTEQFLIALTEKNRLIVYGVNIDRCIFPHVDQDEVKSPIDITDFLDLKPQEKIVQIACNLYAISVITSSNRVLIWGSNAYGTLGNGFINLNKAPYEISLPYIV